MQGDSCTFDFAHEFTDQLRIEGMSDLTISAYCQHVDLFFRHTGIPLTQADEFHLRKYVCGLFDAGKHTDNTIALKIRSLKRFYGFLQRTGRILCDPSAKLRKPVIRHRLPRKVLSEKNMERIRKAIKLKSFYMCRDIALIEVLYSTGIRLSELTGLKIPDLDLSEAMLWIRNGKGGNDRCCVLGRDAVSALEDYLVLRNELSTDSESLWIRRDGSRLQKPGVSGVINQSAVLAGVKGPSNPHAWRHGVATALLRRGASILEVQKFLGHASPKTTQIYTHLTVKDLQRIHNRTHPREFDPDPPDLPASFPSSINHFY